MGSNLTESSETSESSEVIKKDIEDRLAKLDSVSQELLALKEANAALHQKLIEELSEKEQANGDTMLSNEELIQTTKKFQETNKTLIQTAREKAKKETITKVNEEIDKSLGWVGKIPWIGEGIKNFLTGTVSYSLDKKFDPESFEKNHKNKSFGWFKNFIGTAILGLVGWKNSDVGKLVDKVGTVSVVPAITTAATAAGGAATALKKLTEKGNKEKPPKVDEAKTDRADTVDQDKAPDTDVGQSGDISEKPPVEGETASIMPETLRENAYYFTGVNVLIGLSLVPQETNRSNDEILLKLKTSSYNDLKTLADSPEEKNAFMQKNFPETSNEELKKGLLSVLDKTLDGILSDKTETLLGFAMKKKYLTDIILPKGNINGKLAQHITEDRLRTILSNSSDSNNSNWKNLSIEELSILYTFSVPALGLPITGLFGNIGSEIKTFISNGVDIKKLGDSTEDFFPSNIIKQIAKNTDTDLGGGNYMFESKDNIFQETVSSKLDSPHEKNKLKELITFKNALLDSFVKNKKIHLSYEEQTLFRNNLDYKWVIALYGIMGGNSNFDDINPINLPGIVFTTSKILSSGRMDSQGVENSYKGKAYMGRYLLDALSGDSFLNDEELKVFEIYEDKVFHTMVYSYLRQLASILGMPIGAFHDHLAKIGLGALVAGGAIYAGSSYKMNRGIRKGKHRGKWLIGKKLGWWTFFAGAAIGGTSLLAEGMGQENYNKERENAFKNNDPKALAEFSQKDISTFVKYKMPGGKEALIKAFPGDSIKVIYDGSLYTPHVLDVEESIDKKTTWADRLAVVTNALKDLVEGDDLEKRRINGKLIDTKKISLSKDKKSILLGEGNAQISVSIGSITGSLSKGEIKEYRGALQNMLHSTSETLYNGESRVWGDNGEFIPYLHVSELGDGKSLVLQKIGKVTI